MEPFTNPQMPPIGQTPMPGSTSFPLLPSWVQPSQKKTKITRERLGQIIASKPSLYYTWIAALLLVAVVIAGNVYSMAFSSDTDKSMIISLISVGLQAVIAYLVYRMHWLGDFILGALLVLSIFSVFTNGFFSLLVAGLLFILNKYVLSNITRYDNAVFTAAVPTGVAPEQKSQVLKIVLVILGFLALAAIAFGFVAYRFLTCGDAC